MDMAVRTMELILVQTAVLLLMVMVHGVDGADATTEQVAYVGQDVVLRCPLTDLYTISYPSWSTNDGILYTQIGGSINPAYADRVSYYTDNTSLVIKNITLSDAGSYTCTMVISGITKDGINTLHTRIRPQPPVISNRQSDGTVTGTEGQPLTLTCTSRGGYPEPTVTWYRGTTFMTRSNSGSLEGDGYTVTATFTFSPTSLNDGSIYICQTSYTSPTLFVMDSVNATLRLNLKPSQPTVEQVGDVVAGSTVIVRCTTSGFHPANSITISWTYKGGDYSRFATTTTKQTGGTDTYTAMSTLQFTVQKVDNGGTAKCIVVHSTLGTSLTGTATINVHYRPESAAVTGNHVIVANGANRLTLSCVVGVGNPAVMAISWIRTSRTGTVYPVSTQNPLVLRPTRDDDGDTITCTANNTIGSVTSAPVTLNLKFHPITTVTISPTGAATEGSTDVTLQCSAHSKLAANITWYHNGDTLQGGQLSAGPAHNTYVTTYKITAVSRQDAGEYKCIATNTISPPSGDTSNTAVVTLDVHFPPLSAAIEGNRVIEADGHNKLQLNCLVGESNPISAITWTKTGKVDIGTTHAMQDTTGSYGGYTRSRVLELTPTRDDDGATITCTAGNGVGQSLTHTITLNLKYNAIATIPRGDETVVEGSPSKDLTCNANSKPAATFTWERANIGPILASGQGTGSGNQWTSTYTIIDVDRKHADQYRCLADNGVGDTGEKTMHLTVYYPPDVTATAQLNNGQIVATCSPSGVPDTYHYSPWVHLWSDGTRISQAQLAATQTLLLTPLTYQDSGIYKCGAGNGVGLHGAMSANYIQLGSTSVITIESLPIIIGPEEQKVPIQLHKPSTVSITYYSNVAGSTVSCHRVVDNITQTQSVGEVTTDTFTSPIQLPVYGSMVSEQGTSATVTLTLDTEDELGYYVVRITNTVGTAVVHLLAVPEGGYIMVEEITQWPAKLYNGTDSELILTCNILTIGYLDAEDFTYWWTYNGIVLQPKSTSRFTLTTSTLDIPQQKQSRLKLTPLRSYDSGTYACFVSHKASGAEAGRNITLSVISQPVVTLTPGSLTVNEGADVSLECKVIHPLDRPFEFRWYRNGEVLQSRAGETFIPDDTSVQLLITAITETTKFGCEAENEAGNGTRATSYIGVIPATVDPEEPTACNVALDYRGRKWPITAVDTIAVQDCPSQTLGTVMRSCKQNGEWATANYNCVQDTIRTIQQQINQAQYGSGSANVTSSLGDLAHATDIDELLEGDMLAVIDTLASVAVVAEETITAAGETETETQNFLEVASNLLDEKHKDTWDADIDQGQPGAIDVAQVVESFIKAKVKQLSSSTNESFTKHYKNTNIFCEIGRSNEADTSAYTFPNRGAGLPSWIEDTTTALYIPAESFSGMAREYSSQVYRNLPDIVVKKLQTNGQIQDSGSMDINSDVTIAFQSQQPVINLDPPARITFQHSSPNYSRPICVFWDFGETTWSSQGCAMVSTSDTHTVCACNHFTNFAVLMSPGKTPGPDQLALSIISAIGCGVSLLCLVCTVAAHLRVWRLVKSDRSTLLMHLCVALIVAYVVFLAGINRAENKDVCTAIAALLHYFWLVVFFLMLAEGIEIAVSVIYVFVTKSRVKWLVPLAWGLPAVIVGVSLGVSRLDGYGTDTFCWLSTESGLLWAFVGPAAFVILVNFIIIIVVFRKMFKSSAMLTKTDNDKAKTGVRSLCVLLPVLGLSWVFGIFSVNEDLVAFQYIFAICNALQGFFIFLFHCCFNRQLKYAWKQTQIRRKSLASFEDSYKKQNSSVTGSTTYYSADGSRKQSNELQVSNTFLDADRQMQELAKKDKLGSSNNFNKTPNNKLDKDKTPNVDVALKFVQISNILRESEVMGEAAGISSILNTQDKQPASDSATTRIEEQPEPTRQTVQRSCSGQEEYGDEEISEGSVPSVSVSV